MKNLHIVLAALAFLILNSNAYTQIIDVCATNDTIVLKTGNYQHGTVEWESSYDGVNWEIIEGEKDTLYRFFPSETKYYRAVAKFSECPPEYSVVSFVQMPPVANAGVSRTVPDNSLLMMANKIDGAVGSWSILSGYNGSFGETDDPYTEFQGDDSLYTLVWTLTNACGTSSDTIEIQFVENTYIDHLVIVDTTDLLLSDSTQIEQGLYILRFSSPVPNISDSTVLIGLINEGFLRKVDSFTLMSDTFFIYTSQGTLEDIIIDGSFNIAQVFSIDTSITDNTSSFIRLQKLPTRNDLNNNPMFKTGKYYYVVEDEPIYLYDGVTLNSVRNSTNSIFDINFRSVLNESNIKFELNGNYKFNPNFVADIDFEKLALKYAKFGMYNAQIERNISIKLSAYTSATLLNKKFTLMSITKNMVVLVGAVPVWVKAELKLEGELSANATASMSITDEYTKISNHTALLEYSFGQWKSKYNETSQLQTSSDFKIEGNLSQSFQIGPMITFKIYDIVGPYIEAKIKEDLTVCGSPQGNWKAELDIGGEISVGARAVALGQTFFDVYKSWGESVYNVQLPYKISIVSGNNQNYIKGNPLPEKIKVNIASNKGFSVPFTIVRFTPKNGGSVTNYTVVTDANGIAETTWIPGGTGESELQIQVLDCSGKDINRSPVFFKAYESGVNNCTKSSLSVSIVDNGNQISPKAQMGKPPYQYSTDGINYSSQIPAITTNPNTCYTFFIKDNTNCIASVSYSAPNTACLNSKLTMNTQVMGNVITVSVTGGKPPYLYALDNQSGTYSSSNTFTNVTIGTHAVYVKDDNSCIASGKVQVSSNNPSVIANFTVDKIYVIKGENVKFGDLSNNATSWLWNFGDGNTSTQQNPSYTYNTDGKYTVSLTATNSFGSDKKIKVEYIFVGNNGSNIFTDSRDGNVYKTVRIGNQVWMAENLKYLPSVVVPGTGSVTTPYYYVSGYNGTNVNDAKASSNYNTYGVLYNWPAAMAGSASSNSNPSDVQGVCPAGWHLPSDAEWTQLTDHLGGVSEAGGKLKESGTIHWQIPNTGATNETGFSALPGGYRFIGGSFSILLVTGSWWSATEVGTSSAYTRDLHCNKSDISRSLNTKDYGFSVRCVKN